MWPGMKRLQEEMEQWFGRAGMSDVFPLGLLALAFDRQLVVAVDEDFQVAQLKLRKLRFNVQVAVVLPMR
jgi:hypothetical protein